MMKTAQYLQPKFGPTSWLLSAILPLIFLLLTACANNASAEPTPPTIHYGEDVCEFCNMIISDERYAAGYITQDGRQHIFDDIGNMFRSHLAKNDQVIAFFVHNHADKNWIRAEKAFYVHSNQLITPMLSGFAAFEAADQANILAAEMHGQVMTFDEVLAYYQTNPMPHGEHGMEHEH
jgi:copper chaperone NosL